MQYLLSKEEFEALGPKSESVKWQAHAQALATMVAENVPRKGINGDRGCILTSRVEYCDLCPAEERCPYTIKAYRK